MSGRSTRASLAAEAAATQLETIDVRLQRTEETQERMSTTCVIICTRLMEAVTKKTPGSGFLPTSAQQRIR